MGSVTNWAGQEITPGLTVWRGARQGDSSTFRVGTVLDVNEVKRTVRVHWLFEQSNRSWIAKDIPVSKWQHLLGVRAMDVKSTCTVDSVTIAVVDLERLKRDDEEWNGISAYVREQRQKNLTRP